MTVSKRQSFRLKLCLRILGISIDIFILIFCAIYYYVAQEVRHDLRATADAKLDYVMEAIDKSITATEISAENLYSISRSPLVSHQQDSIYSLCEHFLDANPHSQGVAIGFMPNTVKGHEKGFSPYVMRSGGKYIRRDLAETKNYRESEWFKQPIEQGKRCWIKPFLESNGTIITCYCIPIVDAKGTTVGVMAVDLALNDLNDMLQKIKPYPNSMLTIVDADGTFIAHPIKEYIYNESIQSLLKKVGTDANRSIFDSIKMGKRGVGSYQGEMGTSYVFHAQEPKTDWTVTLEVPESDVAQGLRSMRNILILIMILGALILVSVSFVVITRLTRPLEQFAHVARGISHGDFSRQLPVVKDHNELYDLRQALAAMKGSLDSYIEQLKESTTSKAVIESELNTARRIQLSMVPKIFPPYPERKDLDVYGSLTPAKAVGGDLYDFVLDGDDFYFCIGDVSGKGVPASLFMAITRSLFRNNVTHAKSPAAVATLLNDAIAQNNDENMFVTMFIGCCNLKTGQFRCCNCGHNAPATNGHIVSTDPVTIGPTDHVHLMEFAPTNLPIGVMPGMEFQEVSAQLQPGVRIMLYTDGITEAEDKEAKLYGDNRLLQTLSQLPIGASAQQAVEHLIADVHLHTNGADQSDDITLLCMHYLSDQQH